VDDKLYVTALLNPERDLACGP